MVSRVPDPVERRVAHVEVRRRHVDLGAQHVRPVLELAGPHPRKQVEVLLDRPIAIRAVAARLGERTAIGANLVGVQAVHVRLPSPDQLDGELIQLLEVVGGKEQRVPLEPEPLHVLADGVHVLDVFLGGVRVVEAEVAGPAVLLGDAEVQADRLGVADVQVAVRLGRKARRHPPAVLPGGAVFGHDRADEIGRCRRRGRCVLFCILGRHLGQAQHSIRTGPFR